MTFALQDAFPDMCGRHAHVFEATNDLVAVLPRPTHVDGGCVVVRAM